MEPAEDDAEGTGRLLWGDAAHGGVIRLTGPPSMVEPGPPVYPPPPPLVLDALRLAGEAWGAPVPDLLPPDVA